jgi:intein/homing endonuclease
MNFNVSGDLAEICGIHAGDGYLRNDGKRAELDISGNTEEKEYYDKHVIPLFNRTFKIKIKGRFFYSRNTYGFVIRNKNIVKILNEIGFPYGKKTYTVKIPSIITKSNDTNLFKRFLRGLFDTDGCLTFDKEHKKIHYYPRIIIPTTSFSLFKGICFLLNKIEIPYNIQFYRSKNPKEKISYRIWIRGKERLEKWMKLIDIKNTSKSSRYLVWKKYGFCPPNTTLKQRKEIIYNNLSPNVFYGPVAQLGSERLKVNSCRSFGSF